MPFSPTRAELDALQRLADLMALRIIRACRIPRHEREDLRQDLLADLFTRLRGFDPQRGTLSTFAFTCFGHRASHLIDRIHMPRARDAAILSRTRSPITSHSNCAKDSRIFSVSRPIDVVVLKDCVTETKVIPAGLAYLTGCRPARRRLKMQQADNAKLKGLAEHARLSHAHWLREARKGGIGKHGSAYCIEGAGVWRQRLGELLMQIRNAEPAQ